MRLSVEAALEGLFFLLVHDPYVLDGVLVLGLDALDLDHVLEPVLLHLHSHLLDLAVVLEVNHGLGLFPLGLSLGNTRLPVLSLHLPLKRCLALVNEHLLNVQLHLLHRLLALVNHS